LSQSELSAEVIKNVKKQPTPPWPNSSQAANNKNKASHKPNQPQRPTTMSVTQRAIKLSWLDLRGAGLSVIERLCLEEALLRHDPMERSWAIVGTHEPLDHRFLSGQRLLPNYVSQAQDPNHNCIIVMGIGGKPDKLLNIDLVKQDGVVVIKRFSGGGTVILDPASIWTSFIGRNHDFPHVEPYPKSIMQWSADSVFAPAFSKLNETTDGVDNNISGQKTLVVDYKSCSATDNSGMKITLPTSRWIDDDLNTPRTLPDFLLRENDYVLGERKMGGNAQSIVKGGWLHHTSFLWDYDNENMEYLSLPAKRPDYRGDRSHDDFLVKLKTHYGKSNRPFFKSLKEACAEEFDLEEVTLSEAMSIVEDLGGMQTWFEDKSRTRIVQEF
jgi:lipoate-protein ligase A